MSKKNNVFSSIVEVLESLKNEYPSLTLSSHIMVATDGDLWDISNRELLNILKRYRSSLDNSVPINTENIVEEGLDINHIFDDED